MRFRLADFDVLIQSNTTESQLLQYDYFAAALLRLLGISSQIGCH